MTERRASYGAPHPVLESIPDQARETVRLIVRNPDDEAAGLLLQFAAALVHPDYVCSLAQLDALPIEHKQAVLELFEYHLTSGFSPEARGALLRALLPYLARPLGASRSR